MKNHISADDHQNQKPPRRKQRLRGFLTPKRIFLGVIFVLLLGVVVGSVVQVVLAPPLRNDLGMRGSFEVEVGPQVEVYIGREFIGNGSVKVSWDDLLGPASKPPLAIPLDPDAPSPSAQTMGRVTAEALAGEGSEIIWTKQGMSGQGQFLGGPFAYSWKKVLLRQANGALDSLSVLDGEFPAQTGNGIGSSFRFDYDRAMRMPETIFLIRRTGS